ncbi:MAG: hypothetical protein ACAI35_14575 [Candidatus Methylacidiphilales bacterium]
MYFFSDGCPTDWLQDGKDDQWHTIVNMLIQSDPQLQPMVDQGNDHVAVLDQDTRYQSMVKELQKELSTGKLGKWRPKHIRKRNDKERYRESFCKAFTAIVPKYRPLVSACSFQEKVLRDSKQALLNDYNQHIGGVEGRGIGFGEYIDSKNRRCMKHSYVNFYGYHEIDTLENKALVLLLMAFFVADQYVFHSKKIRETKPRGIEGLRFTVVSDTLSGDDQDKRFSEENLRKLIDPDPYPFPENAPIITLTRSPASDTFSGDLIVDNLAGWLNSAMMDPTGKYAQYARNLASKGVWAGWHHLLPSTTKLVSEPAINRDPSQD